MSDPTSLREKETAYGLWSVTGHPAIIDAAAAAGPDFVVVDTQHGVDLGLLDASLFTVLAHYGVAGLVRVPAIHPTPIGRALDLGAAGVIVPLVESAHDAENAVAATRYAPSGKRSYGMQTRRVGAFEHAPFVAIQIETAAAVGYVDAIAAVDGVDALYIGPADLGLGIGGETAADVNEVFDGNHPLSDELAAAFSAVVAECRGHGIVAGLHVGDGATAARAREHGFTFASVSADVGLVGKGLEDELAQARKT
ncbi:MAG TPA: aldolase/citrate lyase family protein [Acidimicrobiia bacterium]|nr:aldolase/citrate lyase family protein [Acidimicrobiia bacterium]